MTGSLALEQRRRLARRDHRHRRRHDPRRRTRRSSEDEAPPLRRADAGRHLRALLQHRHHPRRPAARARGGSSRARSASASASRPGSTCPARTPASSGRCRAGRRSPTPRSRWGRRSSLNALQLARITAVVANGGLLVQPHVVTRIVEPDGASSGRVAAAGAGARPLGGDGAVDLATSSWASSSGAPARRRRSRASRSPARPARRRRPGVGGYQRRAPRPQFRGLRAGGEPALRRRRRARGAAGQVLRRRTSRRRSSRTSMSQALGILRVAPRGAAGPGDGARRGAGRRASRGTPSGVVPVAVAARSSAAEAARRRRPDRTPSALGMSRPRQALAVFARLGVLARLQGSGFVVAQDPPAGLAGPAGLGPHPFPRR